MLFWEVILGESSSIPDVYQGTLDLFLKFLVFTKCMTELEFQYVRMESRKIMVDNNSKTESKLKKGDCLEEVPKSTESATSFTGHLTFSMSG